MKGHRFNKSYNSRLTRWVDRILPFDFNIEHIPVAKMGLVDYISRQPNQQAKVTNKYDEEFAVATITRIRDAIAAIYVNTTPQNCQSERLSSVNHTHLTCLNSSLNKPFQFAFALTFRTTQLLLKKTANAAQIQSNNNSNMSRVRNNPKTPPTSAPNRVTFQSTPNSAGNSTRSSNDEQVSPILDLSKEEVFEKNLTQLFTKGSLAVLTSKVQS